MKNTIFGSNTTLLCSLLLLALQFTGCSTSRPEAPSDYNLLAEPTEEGHSMIHKVFFYIPNRVFDLMDIFRFRLKVGPGLAAGVRATEIAQIYAGSETSVWAGLPGPRCSEKIPFPAGLESYNGVALGPVDATANMWLGPDYSPTEFGVALHPFLLGLDFGVDPYEIIDLGVGIFGFDIRDDDL